MTVAELIENLKEFRQDAEVGILVSDGGKEPDYLTVPIVHIGYLGRTLALSRYER